MSKFNKKNQTAINEQIRSRELRVIGPDGENYGVIKTSEALSKARELELDLIEINALSVPPIAKIMDYGKYTYELSKKLKAQKAKAHNVEVKSVQVKVATSENDLSIKAKRASSWLAEGHRIKLELFLPGRTKYLNEDFLKDRLGRILKLLTVDYKVAEEAKKSPKGFTMIIEKAK